MPVRDAPGDGALVALHPPGEKRRYMRSSSARTASMVFCRATRGSGSSPLR